MNTGANAAIMAERGDQILDDLWIARQAAVLGHNSRDIRGLAFHLHPADWIDFRISRPLGFDPDYDHNVNTVWGIPLDDTIDVPRGKAWLDYEIWSPVSGWTPWHAVFDLTPMNNPVVE